MDLPLDDELRFGWATFMDSLEAVRSTTALADDLGLDSLWVGDHIAFSLPMMDPLLQLAQAAVCSERLMLGTGVYLLPLRHPVTVAKQVASLDRLSGGRVVFGVGIGGEFPNEYAACGVPIRERGARLSEGIEVLRKLWRGHSVSHQGKFYPFNDVLMLPEPVQPGGPPIWCGGRSTAALQRAGRLANGYISYVVTPDMYRAALETITQAAAREKRIIDNFATAHVLFFRIDRDFDSAWKCATTQLSERYASDFSGPAKKYCLLGRPEDIATQIAQFRAAGVRHFILDPVSPPQERQEQISQFAQQVKPLLD